MRRLRDERGGIAVMLALLMPVLFGAAALAIDTAAVWSARQQVETGADAAVLAVATDCADPDIGCGDIKSKAEAAFWANDKAGKVSDLGPGEGWISVTNRGSTGDVSATQKTPWTVDHFFAAALGFDTGELSAQSFASWAPLTHARAVVPLAISKCEYDSDKASGTATLALTTAISGSCGTALTAVDPGAACATTSSWKDSVAQRSTLPSGCSSAYLTGLAGRDVVVPVFDSATSGSSATVHVYGYAAFHVTSASTTALTGSFTYLSRQVDDTTPPATTAPDLGARAVYLTPDK